MGKRIRRGKDERRDRTDVNHRQKSEKEKRQSTIRGGLQVPLAGNRRTHAPTSTFFLLWGKKYQKLWRKQKNRAGSICKARGAATEH